MYKGFGPIGIDDSDVTKPDGHRFEALGIVRDDSESSAKKTSTKKAITLLVIDFFSEGKEPLLFLNCPKKKE